MSEWTWNENKQFEECLEEFGEDYPDRWSAIATRLGTKTTAEVEQHYMALVEDINTIEAGLIAPPQYVDEEDKDEDPWTDEEHRLFLLGLEKYGKGEWKSIARDYVKTKRPAQVSSYAQKYFAHQEDEDGDDNEEDDEDEDKKIN